MFCEEVYSPGNLDGVLFFEVGQGLHAMSGNYQYPIIGDGFVYQARLFRFPRATLLDLFGETCHLYSVLRRIN